ncbi:MAG: ribonuclease P protein component [Gammaproteobacteria bacterium]
MSLSSPTNSFSPEARLRTPADFNRTFRIGARTSDSYFRVYASPGHFAARLGISVARKAVPNATARNRIKRQVRESFRNHRTILPAVDIVIQVKSLAASQDNAGLRSSLEWHWQELIKQCAAS